MDVVIQCLLFLTPKVRLTCGLRTSPRVCELNCS